MGPATEQAVRAGRASVVQLPLDLIDRDPRQPRQSFNEASLRALAASLEKHSLLQPILVRPGLAGRYRIVAGERRWRAAMLAGWETMPAIVRDLTERAAAELAIVENEQREPVKRIETIRAMQRLVDEHGYTHDDLALALGSERATVSHLLRLLRLDPEVQQMIGDGIEELSLGHARTLVSLTKFQQRTLANRCVRQKLSVRQLEQLVRKLSSPDHASATANRDVDPNVREAAERLRLALGQPVDIQWSAEQGRGAVQIRFHSLEELDGFLERVGQSTSVRF